MLRSRSSHMYNNLQGFKVTYQFMETLETKNMMVAIDKPIPDLGVGWYIKGLRKIYDPFELLQNSPLMMGFKKRFK